MNIWYEAYIRPLYHYIGKDMKMKNEFKPGDLVFEVSHGEGVFLTHLSETVQDTYEIRGQVMCYLHDGRYSTCAVLPSLFHATPEMREKLVAIWGEDAVPKLPVRGSELTKKLLEQQKYVFCLVSDVSDEDARKHSMLAIIESYTIHNWFSEAGSGLYRYAVPIDNNGNEITEIE